MRRVLIPGLALASFALSLTCLPEAAASKTYTLPSKETWKVGDAVTRIETQKQVQKQTVTAGGQVVQQGDETVATAFEGVLEVKEVNAAGEYTHAVAFIKSWRQTKGDAVDESLTGAHVELRGAGSARTAKILTPGLEPSEDAAKWLDEELGTKAGSKQGKADDVFNPGRPVAVGESWNPDMAKVAALFGGDDGEGLTFDRAASTAKLTLKEVVGDLATIAIEFDLKVSPISTPAGELPWKEGGLMTVRAEMRKSLTASNHVGSAKMKAELVGKAGNEQFDLALDVQIDNTGEMKAGGKVPAMEQPAEAR